jgi:hypothetical protein
VLPDPHCTPGVTNPAVNQGDIGQTICSPGWTATIRPPESYTEPLKYEQMAAYGETGPASNYEEDHLIPLELGQEDHLIPLELGGSPTSVLNLWPEPGASPNPKDGVENAANQAVCDGRMTLVAAQEAIASDWISFGRQLGVVGNQMVQTAGSAVCTVSASYNASYRDYDVYVHSNQPDQTVQITTSGGESASWHTDANGYADVYLHVAGEPTGQRLVATVGAASCSTTF